MSKTATATTTLQAAIAEITGKTPQSTEVEYLERRLASLKKRKSNGRKAATRYSESTIVLSVSMHGAAKNATIEIAGGEKIGISELVRRAVAEYAARRGYKPNLVATLMGGDS